MPEGIKLEILRFVVTNIGWVLNCAALDPPGVLHSGLMCATTTTVCGHEEVANKAPTLVVPSHAERALGPSSLSEIVVGNTL